MNLSNVFLFLITYSILLLNIKVIFVSASNGCETVLTTTSIPQGTFIYTATQTVPAESAETVTKIDFFPENIDVVTTVIEGTAKTLTIYSTTIIFKGATTTSTSLVTYTTYPNAVTSIYSTETIYVFVEGTLTVTYPPPVVIVNSSNRYTGAPTSLWLSVI